MSGSLNKVFLIGRLGQQPEIRTTASGQRVAKFSLATNESYQDKDGQRIERTEWHRVVAWGKQADFVEKYLSKGVLAYIEGMLETSKWLDQHGVTRSMTEIKALRVTGLSYTHAQNDPPTEHKSTLENCDLNTTMPGSDTSFPLQSCDMDNLPF